MYIRVIYLRYGSIDFSEARINAVKQGDLAAYLAFDLESQGHNANITLSTIVNNGNDVAQLNTNNVIHWHSPSDAWIETGMIVTHSDVYLIDIVQWNASGLVEYASDQYVFYANDYSDNGDERFLTYGYGTYDFISLTSW